MSEQDLLKLIKLLLQALKECPEGSKKLGAIVCNDAEAIGLLLRLDQS